MLKSIALLGLALSGLVLANGEDPSCRVHDCNTGHTFDLSGLSSDSDYVVSSPTTGRNLTLNVCKSVVSDLWNPQVDHPQDIGAFYRGAHGDISIGKVNTTLQVRDGHPVLVMTDGSSCPHSDSIKASTVIRFSCDAKVTEEQPTFIAQLPPSDDDACAFFFEWKTSHACPVPSRYAYWKTAVMVIVILLALILTALALLSLHRLLKLRRSQEGYEAASYNPSRGTFFTYLGEHLRDLKRHLTGQDPWGHPRDPLDPAYRSAMGTNDGSKKSWRPSFKFGRKKGFSRLPQSAEEEAMMGNGGPYSIDDEEEDEGGRREVNGTAESFAEESAAWGAQRPRGLDGNGVIRL